MHVILAVADAQRSAAFYESVFGWERNPRVAHWTNYVELFQPDGSTLGLFDRDGFSRTAGATLPEPNGHHSDSYLYVRVDDVSPLLEKLEGAGATPLSPLSAREWGDDAAYFADPDGHVVAVAQFTR